jgi:hypothetical protein
MAVFWVVAPCSQTANVGLYFLTYVDSFLVDVVEVVSLIDWLQVEVLASSSKQSVFFELTVMLLS